MLLNRCQIRFQETWSTNSIPAIRPTMSPVLEHSVWPSAPSMGYAGNSSRPPARPENSDWGNWWFFRVDGEWSMENTIYINWGFNGKIMELNIFGKLSIAIFGRWNGVLYRQTSQYGGKNRNNYLIQFGNNQRLESCWLQLATLMEVMWGQGRDGKESLVSKYPWWIWMNIKISMDKTIILDLLPALKLWHLQQHLCAVAFQHEGHAALESPILGHPVGPTRTSKLEQNAWDEIGDTVKRSIEIDRNRR